LKPSSSLSLSLSLGGAVDAVRGWKWKQENKRDRKLPSKVEASKKKEYIFGPVKAMRMFQSDGVEKRFQIGRL
jgi:hypothetical protein